MKGAYTEQLREGQNWKPLPDKVMELEAFVLPSPDSIVSTLNIDVKYHPALSSIALANTNWYSESGNVAGLQVLYVPTLEQLGFGEGYSLRAYATAILGVDDQEVDVRVLEIGTANVPAAKNVTREDVSAELAGTDFIVDLPVFIPTPGASYFVDVRQVNAGVPAVSIKAQKIFLQIIKD
jgi:hypothetical protein